MTMPMSLLMIVMADLGSPLSSSIHGTRFSTAVSVLAYDLHIQLFPVDCLTISYTCEGRSPAVAAKAIASLPSAGSSSNARCRANVYRRKQLVHHFEITSEPDLFSCLEQFAFPWHKVDGECLKNRPAVIQSGRSSGYHDTERSCGRFQDASRYRGVE